MGSIWELDSLETTPPTPSLSKYLLSDYHVPGSSLGTGDSAVNKTDQSLGSHRFIFQGDGGKTDNNKNRFTVTLVPLGEARPGRLPVLHSVG